MTDSDAIEMALLRFLGNCPEPGMGGQRLQTETDVWIARSIAYRAGAMKMAELFAAGASGRSILIDGQTNMQCDGCAKIVFAPLSFMGMKHICGGYLGPIK